MKIVLRHISTGRYYQSPGKWVRRADNALAFDEVGAAWDFSRLHHLAETQPVHRLAPYLIPLLQRPGSAAWESWLRARANQWHTERSRKFGRN
jgi:hypothetical protein